MLVRVLRKQTKIAVKFLQVIENTYAVARGACVGFVDELAVERKPPAHVLGVPAHGIHLEIHHRKRLVLRIAGLPYWYGSNGLQIVTRSNI